jgi:hypothetical protein
MYFSKENENGRCTKKEKKDSRKINTGIQKQNESITCKQQKRVVLY